MLCSKTCSVTLYVQERVPCGYFGVEGVTLMCGEHLVYDHTTTFVDDICAHNLGNMKGKYEGEFMIDPRDPALML